MSCGLYTQPRSRFSRTDPSGYARLIRHLFYGKQEPFKGPLKYLVAKLHLCYPGAISLPVSQKFFARFFRRRPVADSSRCLTFSLRCNKHKKHFLLTFLLINGLLYGYNMCVVPLFFILECFACRKMSSTYGRRLHVTLSC